MLGGSAPLRACGCRALSNGMENPTLLLWRPVLVRGRTPTVVFSARVRNRLEPAMRCGASSGAKRCVQRSLPCVGLANGRSVAQAPARARAVSLPETLPAKEAKKRSDCCGNHLGCLYQGDREIAVRTKWQSGPACWQHRGVTPKGKPPRRQRGARHGESLPVPKP